jgi:hypothetical protein
MTDKSRVDVKGIFIHLLVDLYPAVARDGIFIVSYFFLSFFLSFSLSFFLLKSLLFTSGHLYRRLDEGTRIIVRLLKNLKNIKNGGTLLFAD